MTNNLTRQERLEMRKRNTSKPVAGENAINTETTIPKLGKNDLMKSGDKKIFVNLFLDKELDEYLEFRSRELNLTRQEFFKQLMLQEIESGKLDAPELENKYREIQHVKVSKSILIEKNIKEKMDNKALYYHMKKTAFVTYVIHKAYSRDMEYHRL